MKDETVTCSLISRPRFKIPMEVYTKLLVLLHNFNTEWIAYLPFDKTEDSYVARDVIVPEQEVTSSSCVTENGLIGDYAVIHAHQFTSSSFYSSIDEAHVNVNNPFSLVINGKGEIIGKGKVSTPCGKTAVTPITVEICFDKSFLAEAKSKIKSKASYNVGRFEYYETW